jgi:hypothetical protein
MKRGVDTEHMPVGDLDSINLFNGNLNLRIRSAVLPGERRIVHRSGLQPSA